MASPITASQASSVDDILDAGRFLMLFGSVPGTDETMDFSIRCFNATISGTSSEIMEVPLHGYTLRFRGRKVQSSPLSVAFWEDSTMSAYTILWDWMEFVTGSEDNNSQGYLQDYSVTAQLSMFDTTGVEASRFTYDYLFIQDITDISLSSESSSPMQIQAQFAYRQKRKIAIDGLDVGSANSSGAATSAAGA